jgi:hypothetical protein
MHPPTYRAARSRADRSDPPRLHAQAPVARRGHVQPCKIGERGEPARHTPRQRVVVQGAAHPKRTRPLGGSTTPHPRKRCALTVPAHRTPWEGRPLSTPQSHRVLEVSSQITATSPAAAPPPLDAPDMHPPTCRAARSRADRSDPPRPQAQAPWQEEGTHSHVSLVSAESELGTLPFSLLLLRALHTRSGLGRSGGNTTPHPQQPCAPTVPAHCTRWMECPLSTPQSHRVQGSPL